MKLVYIGCVKSSLILLEQIIMNTEVELVGIVTMLTSKVNSDHVSLEKIAQKNNIDWIEFTNNHTVREWIEKKKPDLIYCFGWSYLLPKEIYDIPRLGTVGYHPALLPQNRGRHPIIWAIALGLKETGSTFFMIDANADSGDIVNQRVIPISTNENARTLYEKLMVTAKEQVVELTNGFIGNSVLKCPQDDSKANYWRKRSVKDGEIDWRMCTENVLRLIRALTAPYVGAHFIYKNKMIKVWKAEKYRGVIQENIEPGKVLGANGNSLIVKTGDGAIRLLELENIDGIEEGEYL